MIHMVAERSMGLRRTLLVGFFVLSTTWTVIVTPASAEQRFIVRTTALSALNLGCLIARCTVQYALDGALGRVFLVTTADGIDVQTFLTRLLSLVGIVDAELDQVVKTLNDDGAAAPPGLYDRTLVNYYGSNVWHGYVAQPAAVRVGVADAQGSFGLTGQGVTVAVIDTGVDPDHPALAGVVTNGYDFTRNVARGSERNDLTSPDGRWNESTPAWRINQSTMVILDQSTMVILDNPEFAAFGHGTMVAGVIHLVAPQATIMPLKAFGADGTGYSSDVLRAIYYAIYNGAKVLNMSFSYAAPSRELRRALDYATSSGLAAIGSAGNSGQHVAAYPAALPNVIGVASTDDGDVISEFSNYGEDLFLIAAPGEAIISTYPFGTYGAAWGTSFSAPFASGTAALLAQLTPSIDQSGVTTAVAEAVPIAGVARGRLDVLGAVSSRTCSPVCP
jgi:subtilisin family serine protease